jgi:hypothetical protein
MKHVVVAALSLGLTGALWAQPVANAAVTALGTNLDAVVDFSPQLPFIDLFKASRPWYGQADGTFDTNESNLLDLDAQGWVRSLNVRPGVATLVAPRFTRVCTLLMSMGPVSGGPVAGQLPYPAGQYVVRYEGQGSISYGLAARKNEALSAPGRDVLDVTPAEPGFQICITATLAAAPLRNIRVYAPGTEALADAGEVFSPSFLQRLQHFSVLRFMDWQHTNNATQGADATRALATDARYSTALGVPAEVMADLATKTGAIPWFNIPQPAIDAWVRAFAGAALARLPAQRPVIVEYTNEIWNNLFTQGASLEAEGVARFAGAAGSNFDKRLNRYGERAAEICRVWRAAAAPNPDRVRCVMAGQAANTYIAETALACPLSSQRPCKSAGFVALAIAPYIGDHVGLPENQATVQGWAAQGEAGMAALFNELIQGGTLPGTEGSLATMERRVLAHAALARAQGVGLYAYEGGQHLVGVGAPQNNNAINTLMDAANRDARMGSLYTSMLALWAAAGGDLFAHFSDIGTQSRFGRWGALELPTQATSPKHDALVRSGRVAYQRRSGCVMGWAERTVPVAFDSATPQRGTVQGFDYRLYPSGHALATTELGLRVWALGPLTGGTLRELGALTDFAVSAGCN